MVIEAASPCRPESMMRALHAEPARHHRQEEPPNPPGHGVSLWWSVVHIQNKHGDDDWERDKDHSEEQVLPNQRDDQWCGWDDLGDEQQEDGERQQHGDAQRDLLAAVWWQVEDQDGQAGDEQAGDDEVDGVEQRQAADHEVVGDVGVDLVTAVVFLGVVGSYSVDDCPFSTLPVVLEVRLFLATLTSCRGSLKLKQQGESLLQEKARK